MKILKKSKFGHSCKQTMYVVLFHTCKIEKEYTVLICSLYTCTFFLQKSLEYILIGIYINPLNFLFQSYDSDTLIYILE